jgi:hypothetical protein
MHALPKAAIGEGWGRRKIGCRRLLILAKAVNAQGDEVEKPL